MQWKSLKNVILRLLLSIGSRYKRFFFFSGAFVNAFDFSAQFLGQKEADYVATFAFARSPVSEKSRFLFYGKYNTANNKKQQVILHKGSF